MAHYFYTGGDGIKRGPYNEQHLQELITRGLIGKRTPLETDTGHMVLTGQVPGLQFGASSDETSPGFFDIGFTQFITNTWISILWVLTIILAILGCVLAIGFALFNEAPILIFIAPIAAALFLLFMRMVFELEIIVFRMETRLRTIEKNSEQMSLVEEHLRAIRKHYENM